MAGSVATVLVLDGPGKLVTRDITLPALAPGQAILRVEACGLCGTDHEMFSGAMPAPLPLVPGHEVVGVIESATDEFWQCHPGLGDQARVALEVFQRCGECDPCRNGQYMLCRNHGLRDSYGNTPLDHGSGLWGGYATHLLLTADAIVHPVPTVLDPVQATLFNPLGAGIRWGVNLPSVSEGDVVTVLGPGLRGLSAVAAAAGAGAKYIMLTGVGRRDAERLQLGVHLGAHAAVDIGIVDAKAHLKSDTGGLADVVVDVTAAAPAAFVQAIDLVRPGGTVVVAGTRGHRTLDSFNPDRIVLKELRILGARGVDGAAYIQALDMLARTPELRGIDHHTAPLDADEVSTLLHDMAQGAHPPLHAVVTV